MNNVGVTRFNALRATPYTYVKPLINGYWFPQLNSSCASGLLSLRFGNDLALSSVCASGLPIAKCFRSEFASFSSFLYGNRKPSIYHDFYTIMYE